MLISGGNLHFSETAKDSEFDVEYNRYLSSTSGKYTHIPLLCINMVSVKVLFLIHIEDDRFCNIYICYCRNVLHREKWKGNIVMV